jgi:hypothetical protein
MSEDTSPAGGEQESPSTGDEAEPVDRWERIACGLEKNFEWCNVVVGGLSKRILQKEGGVLSEQDFLFLARYVRASAHIAGVMARVESIKNRGSNTK